MERGPYGLAGWIKIYRWIVSKLGYSYLQDFLSSVILSILIIFKWIHILEAKRLLFNRIVFIFGASKTLTTDLNNLLSRGFRKWRRYITVIAADTATEELYRHGIYPDIIVTDLDGELKYIISTHLAKGSLVVVHAHGDNIISLIHYIRFFKRVLGTTQSIPLIYIYNLYGFTDGDRAISLAYRLGARKIYLFGMDFRAEPGNFNKIKPVPTDVKRVKLIIGYILCKLLSSEKIVNLSGSNLSSL